MVNCKNLKPVQWYEDTSVIKNIRDAEDPLFLEFDKEHYNSLYHIIEANIKSVANEQRNTSEDLTDFTDEKIERDTCLVCSVCEKNGLTIQYKRTKRKCDICYSQLTKTIKHSNAQSSSTFIYRAVIDPYTKKLQKKPTEESQGDISKSHPTIRMKFHRLKLESLHF